MQAIPQGRVAMTDFTATGTESGAIPMAQSGVIAQFYSEPQVDGHTSKAEGRVVYKNVELVVITIAGDQAQSVRQVVTDRHRSMYSREYEAFRNGAKEMFVEGTPLAEWPQIGRDMVMNLKVMNVFSVEQLAEMTDTNVNSIGMGGIQLRSKAQDWLKLAQGHATGMSLAQENRTLLDEMARLKAQMGAQAQTLAQLHAVNTTVMQNAGGAVPTDDQLGEISQIEDGGGTAPNPDLARQLAEAGGMDYIPPTPIPASVPSVEDASRVDSGSVVQEQPQTLGNVPVQPLEVLPENSIPLEPAGG